MVFLHHSSEIKSSLSWFQSGVATTPGALLVPQSVSATLRQSYKPGTQDRSPDMHVHFNPYPYLSLLKPLPGARSDQYNRCHHHYSPQPSPHPQHRSHTTPDWLDADIPLQTPSGDHHTHQRHHKLWQWTRLVYYTLARAVYHQRRIPKTTPCQGKSMGVFKYCFYEQKLHGCFFLASNLKAPGPE